MSANTSAKYDLYSTLEGNPGVGVWTKNPPAGVILGANDITWTVTPAIDGRGAYKLSIGPYKYTGLVDGKIFLTNDPSMSHDWYILPIENTDTCYISADSVGNSDWTAGAMHEPITIQEFTGKPNQVFKFIEQ